MIITINRNTKAGEIQEAFNELFPNLKLEIYRFSKGRFSGQVRVAMQKRTLIRPAASVLEGQIAVQRNSSIDALEKAFASKFGLTVEVKYKAGPKLIDAIDKAGKTLQAQNDFSRTLSAAGPTPDKGS
jgi:hypothetical protein